MRRLVFVFLLAASGRPLAGQGSPYIPLDHPLLPLAEYLIARGDVADPSPMVRPFRRADLVLAIDAAKLDSTSRSGRVAARLRQAFADRDADNWFRIAPRFGVQGFTGARRDLLHPAGDGGVRPWVDAMVEARVGRLIFVTRPIAENRLKLDPDWAGGSVQRRKNQAWRFGDAYLGGHFGKVRLFYGQMTRNWGPEGSLGIGISSYGYPRSDLALEVRLRDLQIDFAGTELSPMLGADGTTRKRFLMAHRVAVRLTDRLRLAIWETSILAGPNQSFEPLFRNPLVVFAFPVQFGLDDNRNAMIGGDLVWRVGRGLLVEGQAAIDDRWRNDPDPGGTGEPAHPGRWAFTLGAKGPVGGGALWEASLAVVSALAFRTLDSTESFIDRGIGIGPHFTDNARLTLAVGFPVGSGWLVRPDVTILRQGEGRIDAPFPLGQALTDAPELFLGTVATTYRLGASLAGSAGILALRGSAGLHHTVNFGHIPGQRRTRLEAKLLATLGFDVGGVLR